MADTSADCTVVLALARKELESVPSAVGFPFEAEEVLAVGKTEEVADTNYC